MGDTARPLWRPGDLNPRQIRLLEYLDEQDQITNSDYQRLCPAVSAETLRRDLEAQPESGFSENILGW